MPDYVIVSLKRLDYLHVLILVRMHTHEIDITPETVRVKLVFERLHQADGMHLLPTWIKK